MKLSEHFELDEFIQSNTANKLHIDNTPNDEIIQNLTLLCKNVLEPARKLYGRAITISSGYRCPKLNKAVKGTKNSQHLEGKAADLQCDNLTELFNILRKLDFDQLLFEHTKLSHWIHVSYNSKNNRMMVRDNYKV